MKKSLSISLGVFIGISPFWGFQTFLAIFLASVFKLNKVISFGFSNVSIPPMIPFIIYGSLKIGGYILNKDFSLNIEDITADFDIQTHLMQYIIGSFTLAIIMAVLCGVSGYILLELLKKEKR